MLKAPDQLRGFAHAIRTRSDIAGFLPQWHDLVSRAVEDCVYFSPHYAEALLSSEAVADDVRFVTAWDGSRLVGLLPVMLSRVALPGLVPGGSSWMTDYTFSATPLLDAHAPEAAAATLLDGLAALHAGEWVLPVLNSEGAATTAMRAALESRGAPFQFDNEFERASLSKGMGFDAHMQTHVASKRRRELGRSRRRLEETGRLSLRTETHGPGLAAAAEAFLALEASGWKGERGTALACTPSTRAFAMRAFARADRPGMVRIDLLLLDDRPIAAGVIVFAGTTGFTVKGAYDETLARQGVGLVLEQDVIKAFLDEGFADRLDSATNGSHVIDMLWPDRVKVADLVLSLARHGAQARLSGLMRARRLRRDMKARIKALLKR
jgi:CelD/BcsL family acetyltransferase involved in cellulose biosynthesis